MKLTNTIERHLTGLIDESRPEHRLAVGVIRQAIVDYCNDDKFIGDPLYTPRENYITGKMFIEGEGLQAWANIANLDAKQIYDMAIKAKESLDAGISS